jgi:glyoxylase I family protein
MSVSSEPAAAEIAALLLALEQQLLQHATRSSPRALDALLADDFREFGVSGRIYDDKQEIIAALVAEAPSSSSLANFNCQLLSPEIALVTYSTHRVADGPPVSALRSSVWVLRKGRWQLLFHQGTRT